MRDKQEHLEVRGILDNNVNSKLLMKTYDGSLSRLKIKPKCKDSTVEFAIKYYDYDGDGSLVKAKVLFHKAAAIDFEVNLFDNFFGAELFGFYEIFQEEKGNCRKNLQ